jgi:transposase
MQWVIVMKKRDKLTEEQAQELQEQMKKTKKVREYRRLQAVYLYGTACTVEEAARITQYEDRSVTRLYDRYLKNGLLSMIDAPMEGRPRRLTTEQEMTLKEVILRHLPVEYGFSANYNWTATLAKEYIKLEYGINYSIKGVTKIFKRLDLSFTRPTYTLAKASPEKQEQFREAFWKVKKTD